MKKLKIHGSKILLIAMVIAYIMVIQSCHAQKHHHKAVPCPCEKKRR